MLTEDAKSGCKIVVFQWSTEDGDCYDCGLPAAFMKSYEDKFCAVCAANHAAEGAAIRRIHNED